MVSKPEKSEIFHIRRLNDRAEFAENNPLCDDLLSNINDNLK